MPCYYPMQGWRSRIRNANGLRSVVFNVADGFQDMPVIVPCGTCVGCRLEYARGWSIRCMHEASMHDDNCFLTMTVADKWLGQPLGGSRYRKVYLGALDKKAIPYFMKRLRKEYPPPINIRYFGCGEYGEETRRPHYHMLLFGFDFPDKEPWTVRDGYPVWRSATLERLWPYGNTEIGTVSVESACYVARYVTKKAVGATAWKEYSDVDMATGEISEKPKEFTLMSRRPAIGYSWFKKYREEVYPVDSVVVRGRESRPPKAYDRLLQKERPEEYERLVRRRVAKVDEDDSTWERLRVREAVALARVNLKRGM